MPPQNQFVFINKKNRNRADTQIVPTVDFGFINLRIGRRANGETPAAARLLPSDVLNRDIHAFIF